ncbi:uncharacterized protein PAC_11188 [Phialocephala subalpina]|uniref:Heterokaryon incompatibility domain-containing protein n=1 Tax=Phialocephala subalpina TaxID=576137 RepID=A0A1L7X8F5_9HELO|nr:uncharacterized protein PAC_11188 [Phialocephala subalpina]
MTSKSYNSLCGPCRDIINTIREVDWYTDLAHHRSIETLKTSAKEACGVCTVILEYVLSSAFQHETELTDKLFPIKCESDTSSASWQSSFELRFTSSLVENLDLKFTFESMEETLGNQSEYIPSNTTDSPQSWELIGQWLKQCTEHHGRCNATVPESWAPTRLLDIGTDNDGYVRLVERDSLLPGQPYATLSHCWGKIQLIMTTMRTISEHLKGINNEDLPKTFKDAIRIARSLGLRYLWIDSLCIVQDSKDDWVHEADIMSKVYRYAFINIAATGAAQSNEGCFWERDPRVVLPTECSIQWSSCTSGKRTRYCAVPESDVWAQKLVSQPLNTRCWVLQERILSPRVLHFGSEQLFWECREFVACETYPRGLPSSLRGNTIIDIKSLDLGDELRDNGWPAKYISKNSTAGRTLLRKLWDGVTELVRPVTVQEVTLKSSMNNASVYRDWDAVVELYSLGALTFQKDKLVALSGLASAIFIGERNTSADGYLAGLWHSSLPSHLLWIAEKTTVTRQSYWQRKNKVLVPSRYEDYIAPSWSWASLEGKISLTWCVHNYDPRDYLARLEGAEVTWSSMGARFGQVDSGFLKLSGPLASVFWERVNNPALPYPSAATITHIFPRGTDGYTSVEIRPRIRNAVEALFDTVADDIPKELVLLPIVGITKRTAHQTETVIGLVLQQRGDTGEYSRLGFFYTTRTQPCRILRNMPRQTITII